MWKELQTKMDELPKTKHKEREYHPDEDDLIIRLHSLLGNRWSLIAGRLPGRTDNEIKNYWNTHLSKRLSIIGQGSTDPDTDKKSTEPGHELKRKTSKIKNKNSNTNKNNKSNNRKMKNKGMANIQSEKQKVHLPKPTRIASFPIRRNESFDCSTNSGSSGQERSEDVQCFGSKVEGIPWCHLEDVPWNGFKDGGTRKMGLAFLLVVEIIVMVLSIMFQILISNLIYQQEITTP
ncbi:hypothetical protein I3842_Q138600 [Carya illinoinensis]|uniref:Uncharacterized protein n=1 Tax=Carya illinoinensis TaxID=32201 RepID=A0A922D249_CARIL|nr:hypothetical protein I3842_Q138600 [Carya illinoinensis]